MPDAAAASPEQPEDSDFEVDVEYDDDIPLAKKKQKSVRCGVCLRFPVLPTHSAAEVSSSLPSASLPTD